MNIWGAPVCSVLELFPMNKNTEQLTQYFHFLACTRIPWQWALKCKVKTCPCPVTHTALKSLTSQGFIRKATPFLLKGSFNFSRLLIDCIRKIFRKDVEWLDGLPGREQFYNLSPVETTHRLLKNPYNMPVQGNGVLAIQTPGWNYRSNVAFMLRRPPIAGIE